MMKFTAFCGSVTDICNSLYILTTDLTFCLKLQILLCTLQTYFMNLYPSVIVYINLKQKLVPEIIQIVTDGEGELKDEISTACYRWYNM